MTKPLYQGRLDGLCGVYSILNAINNLYVLNDEIREELFKICITYLNKNNILKQSVLSGIILKHIKKMLDECNELLMKNGYKELSYSAIIKENNNISSVWNAIEICLNNEKSKHVLLVGLGNTYDHWSCIVGISKKLVYFCDSDGLKQLKKEDFTTGKTMCKDLLVNHKELLALWVEKN